MSLPDDILMLYSKGWLLALPTNISLGYEDFPRDAFIGTLSNKVLTNSGSIVVEHLTFNPKNEGSNAATGTGLCNTLSYWAFISYNENGSVVNTEAVFLGVCDPSMKEL